ncbi:MAG: SRPBCC domain-containing protein [Candidatus Sulfotelmatobacter sp.]
MKHPLWAITDESDYRLRHASRWKVRRDSRLLVYTWIASWHENKSRRTTVRWELTADASGTHVKVTHSGLADEEAARKDYTGGWPDALEMFSNFIEKSGKDKRDSCMWSRVGAKQ